LFGHGQSDHRFLVGAGFVEIPYAEWLCFSAKVSGSIKNALSERRLAKEINPPLNLGKAVPPTASRALSEIIEKAIFLATLKIPRYYRRKIVLLYLLNL
jgi:hypothetical protein